LSYPVNRQLQRQSINQSIKIFIVATDTARNTKKSYGESPANEKQNRCSLRCSLNAVNDEAEVTCSGSVFQMRAPATGKLHKPMEVSQTAGMIMSSEVEDWSLWREGTSATRTNCHRYCGTSPVRARYVRMATL